MSSIPLSAPPIPLRRIRRMSLILSYFCLALLLSLPIATVMFWLLSEQAVLAARMASGAALPIAYVLHPWQRFAGAGISLMPLGCLLLGLWHVRRCFLAFADGHFFGLDVVTHLRRFAAWACAACVASLIAQPALSVLLTLYNPVGHRQLTLGVSTTELFTLFVAGTIWLIAGVMTHASALAEENAQFI
jgi:hypothetical protein